MNKKYLDYDGLVDVLKRVKASYQRIPALTFKAAVDTISLLPEISSCRPGSLYVVKNEGLTTDDFVVGPGIQTHENDNMVAVNLGTDEEPEMKWDILGSILDVDDRLQYGSTFPDTPVIGDTFLYMGSTVFEYLEVTPSGNENPQEEGWYVYNQAEDVYVLSTDTEIQSGTTYYTRHEKYKKGVIYVYSVGDVWIPQPAGDTIGSISSADIDSLFN